MVAVLGIGALALSLTPTKWVNHFGVLAAFGTMVLALAMLRFPLTAATRAGGQIAGILAVGLGLAVSFAGPNVWRPVTDWGQPFGDHATPVFDRTAMRPFTPHLGPLYGSNLLLWLAAAAAAFVLIRRRSGNARTAASRSGSVLLTTGAAGGVALMVLVFAAAPIRQRPGWSLASSTVRSVAHHDCGLADSVEVAPDANGRFLPAGDVLAGHPVFVDEAVRPVWPCQASTAVDDGLAELPRYRVLAGETLTVNSDHLYRNPANGGIQSILNREAAVVDLPARQRRIGPVQTRFGVVQRVDYALPIQSYDVRVGSRTVPGWWRGPAIVACSPWLEPKKSEPPCQP
jgi:hypothetical protein